MTIENFKQMLINNYRKKNLRNCIGSVEKVVEELFDGIDLQAIQVEAKVSVPSEILSCEQLSKRLKDAINEAFNDMTVFYAPEECGEIATKKLRGKIKLYHSTLVYIDEKNKEALELVDRLIASKH